MMSMMAQMMAKLNETGRKDQGSSSGNDQRKDLRRERTERQDLKRGTKLPKIDFPMFDGDNP